MFGFGFGNRRVVMGGGGPPPPFDPATKPLTGWWKADDYDDVTPYLPGTASAGPSGTRPLGDSVYGGAYIPPKGTGLNGHDYIDMTPDFFRWLNTTGVEMTSDYFDADGASLLLFGTLEDSNTNEADPTAYNNASLFSIFSGFGGLTARNDAGQLYIQAYVYDTLANTNVREFPVNAGDSHLFQFRLAGGVLEFRLGRGAWSTMASGDISFMGTYLATVANVGSAKAKVQEIMTAKAMAQSEFDDFCDYFEAVYGVVL